MLVWTEDLIERLRSQWLAGKTAGQIGQDMKISRNAVLGKARRLCLPSRQDPLASVEDHWQAVIDIVTDFDAPIDAAAKTVGMNPKVAIERWNALCAAGGRQYQ